MSNHHKYLKQIHRAIQQEGGIVISVRHRSHIVIQLAHCRSPLVLSSTPSSPPTLAQLRSRVRRTLRAAS